MQNIINNKIVSFVIPCLNEAGNIERFIREFTIMWQVVNCKYELVFIDDGSQDETVSILKKLKETNLNIKILKLTRNFGKESAVTGGLFCAAGDAVMIVDADLQYPIEKIPEFIKQWQNGSKHVIGLRNRKNTVSITEKIGSYFFNKIIKSISDQNFDSRALDFRLFDRQVVNDFLKLHEKQRIVRGLFDWLGYKPTFVEYEEKPRLSGVAGYTLNKRIKLALNTFVNYSTLPLKLVGVLGITIMLISLLLGLWLVIDRIWKISPLGISGTFILSVFNTFLIGIVLSCLGLVAYYIGSIKTEVSDRPLFIIDEFYE